MAERIPCSRRVIEGKGEVLSRARAQPPPPPLPAKPEPVGAVVSIVKVALPASGVEERAGQRLRAPRPGSGRRPSVLLDSGLPGHVSEEFVRFQAM